MNLLIPSSRYIKFNSFANSSNLADIYPHLQIACAINITSRFSLYYTVLTACHRLVKLQVFSWENPVLLLSLRKGFWWYANYSSGIASAPHWGLQFVLSLNPDCAITWSLEQCYVPRVRRVSWWETYFCEWWDVICRFVPSKFVTCRWEGQVQELLIRDSRNSFSSL